MRLGPSARPATRAEATRTPAVSRGTFLRLFTPVLAAGLAGPAIRGVAPSLGGGTALAVDADTVAEIPASGLIFKDIIKVKGVELYVSDFQRPLTERIAKDFFSDPAQSAVTCVRTGPVTLDPSINKSPEGEEVFSQARALLFKAVKVRRVYDEKTNSLLYISYAERLDKSDDENKSRFKTSMCVLPAN